MMMLKDVGSLTRDAANQPVDSSSNTPLVPGMFTGFILYAGGLTVFGSIPGVASMLLGTPSLSQSVIDTI